MNENKKEDLIEFTKHQGYSIELFKEFMYWIPRYSSRRRQEYIRVIANRFVNLTQRLVSKSVADDIKKIMSDELKNYEDFLLYQRTNEELAFYEEIVSNEYVSNAIDELFEACEKLRSVLGDL